MRPLPSHWRIRLPLLVVFPAVLLVCLGWIAIDRCEELSGGGGRHLGQQMIWSALAAAAMLAAAIPSYRVLARWSYPIFAAAIILLILVYFTPPVHGARRWLRLGPVGVQPSELAKVALVFGLARYLMDGERCRRIAALWVPLGMTLSAVLLVLGEPDLGTALLFVPVLLVMLLVGGAPRKVLAALALAGLLALPLLWTGMSREQKSRVRALFDQPGPKDAVTADTYQLHQAKQVVALGNVWGSLAVGQAVDDPGAYHLPEARSDFVFCLLAERLGLPGAGLVLGLYLVLARQGFAIAAASREPFGRLAAAGLTTLIAIQAAINTGMTVGLLPVVGLSLPLVSYGGSGLVCNGLLVGLLVNIALRPGYEVGREPFRYAVSPPAAVPSPAPFGQRPLAIAGRGGRPRS